MHQIDEAFEMQYDAFLDFVDRSTPAAALQKLRLLCRDDELVARIVDRHEREAIRIRTMDEPTSVYRDNRVTWYTGPRPGDRNWEGLLATLRAKGWSDRSVHDLDDASTKVVSLLDHPRQPRFSTRGLVVGYVQSGKTTNFTAVMAKAADRKYKLFIVLSGIHNALRRQTQIRLEKDLIEANPAAWLEVTTPDHDFVPPRNPKAFVAANNDQKVLLVVKKNATVLRKLKRWLARAEEHLDNCPTLIIDDEADQSTVATRTILPLLRDVLGRFPQVGYIGYTATPFANLLIDPHDDAAFYPRDFVVNLPQPEGHQGTEVLFGRAAHDWEDPEEVPGGHDMIRLVGDEHVGDLKPVNRKEAAVFSPWVCPPLEDSLRWFWLATAARRARGTGNPHSTMLIHTSLEASVHFAFAPLVDEYRRTMLAQVEHGDPGLLDELRAMWRHESSRVRAEAFGEEQVGFDAIHRHLADVLRSTRVVVDNYRSTDRLDYDSGSVTAIAIGGNTLSRGLTLEGLVCSLFVRAASAYDTLLQMGRWFGYRAGYADLPRIWMTRELKEWFRHLATVEAEMRLDIDRYMTEDLDPMRFAVRLRSHPKMLITAKAKMKHAVLASAAYGGELVETRYFKVGPDDVEWLERNRESARRLVAGCLRHGRRNLSVTGERVLFTDVPEDVVRRFIETYEFHERSGDGERRRLISYLDRRQQHGALLKWDVGVIGNARAGATVFRFTEDVAVPMVRRGRLDPECQPLGPGEPADIKTLSSRRDETLDLDIAGTRDLGRRKINQIRREQRDGVGLVLLYPIDPVSSTRTEGRSPLNAPTDVVMGAALVFPEPKGADDQVEFEYYSADLVDQEDMSALETEEEDVA